MAKYQVLLEHANGASGTQTEYLYSDTRLSPAQAECTSKSKAFQKVCQGRGSFDVRIYPTT
jgi:hypothetical protein